MKIQASTPIEPIYKTLFSRQVNRGLSPHMKTCLSLLAERGFVLGDNDD